MHGTQAAEFSLSRMLKAYFKFIINDFPMHVVDDK